MSSETLESGFDRRRFIKASVAAAAAATAAGAGAALLMNKEAPSKAVAPVAALPQSSSAPTYYVKEVADLTGRLASVQAENVRLESQLNIARRQLEARRSPKTERDKSNSEIMQSRLDDANLQIGALSGLVALYDQLDDIDLEDIVSSGLTSVGEALDDLVERVPTVKEGIEAGQAALDELEEQIPLIEDGRLWLAENMNIVAGLYGQVERALGRAVESGGAFLQMLNDWFQSVLKWLPFGIGDKAAEIMNALSDLLAEVPDTLDGLDSNIVRPLDVWLEKDGDETQIQRQVISPVRYNALDPATEAMGSTEALHSIYQTHLKEPIETNIERKQAVRNSIDEYRRTYQV